MQMHRCAQCKAHKALRHGERLRSHGPAGQIRRLPPGRRERQARRCGRRTAYLPVPQPDIRRCQCSTVLAPWRRRHL